MAGQEGAPGCRSNVCSKISPRSRPTGSGRWTRICASPISRAVSPLVAGVEPDREVGKSRLDIAANAADRAFWQAHIDDLLARRPFRDLVYPYSHRDGSVRWFKISGFEGVLREFAGEKLVISNI